jgi:hypothetical protein
MRLFTLDVGKDVGTTSIVADVAALPGVGQVHVGPRDTRVLLRGAQIGGALWDVEIRFEAEAIARVELVARRPGDARSWDEWSMDQETARKVFHEDWAARVLGASFEALRIEVEGKWISTEWPEPAPRQATMPWGQLRSVYDGHASQALLVMMVGFVGG